MTPMICNVLTCLGLRWPPCYNHGGNILRLFDTLRSFQPQVKQSVIIGNKHGIYELSHELPNDLRLWILGK